MPVIIAPAWGGCTHVVATDIARQQAAHSSASASRASMHPQSAQVQLQCCNMTALL
jgi:hypothetical protein